MSTVGHGSSPAGRHVGAGSWRRAQRTAAAAAGLVVLLAVLLANAGYLLGHRSNDPVLYASRLGDPVRGSLGLQAGHVAGLHTIDHNDGWTAQALGRLAARMWTHGEVPLWNVYEGLGQPLAGEQQSAAFFLPFVLLHLLPNGIFVMHLTLELVAGLSTLAFLRTFGLSWVASATGGCLFAVNGVFAVMQNAPFNTIAFLPLCLWGIELVRRAVDAGRRPLRGVAVVALGLAWSLYAGFPETALLQGLFVAGWVLARTSRLSARVAFLGWCVAGAVLGALAAAPILVSLLHFLPFAHTAYHADGVGVPIAYAPDAVLGLFMPYVTGSLGADRFLMAGHASLGVLLLALLGLGSRRPAAVRAFLAVLLAVLVTNMCGVSVVHDALNLLPGMRIVVIYKYGLILIVMAAVILAAVGVDALQRGELSRVRVLLPVLLTLGYVGCVLGYGYAVGEGFFVPGWSAPVVGLSLALLAGLVAAVLARLSAPRRAATLGVAVLLGVEACGLYAAGSVNASPPRPVDTAPVAFLQAHLGTSRFYTLDPIQPNYGSYWQIASINANDLPVPEKYGSYVVDRLRPAWASPAGKIPRGSMVAFRVPGNLMSVPQQRLLFAAYGQQQRYFRTAAVRYLVTSPGVATPAQARAVGLRKVFSSRKAEIYEDPAAQPYWTTSGPQPCEVRQQTRTSVTLSCARATTLVRRELNSPGWSVTVNGRRQPVASSDVQLFQHVPVPAGTSTLQFRYTPDHFTASVVVGLGALLTLLVFLARGGAQPTRAAGVRTAT